MESNPKQLSLSDSEISRRLKISDSSFSTLKHEVEDSDDRTYADEYYDVCALEFLLEAAPLFHIHTSVIPENASTGITSSAKLAADVHYILSRHLEANSSVPIKLPDGYPTESVPHLRSMTRRLWVYLVKFALDRDTPESYIQTISSFFVEFIKYAKAQPSWNSWMKQTDDDLRLSWVLGDYLGESPPYAPANLLEPTAEETVAIEEYKRNVRFAARLVREGFPLHQPFNDSIRNALGRPKKYQDSEDYGSTKKISVGILALPEVLDIGGEVLYGLCFGFDKEEDKEKYAELKREAERSKWPSAEYTEEVWNYWYARAKALAEDNELEDKVRNAAQASEMKMMDLKKAGEERRKEE